MILIVGASGRLGRTVAGRLLTQGKSVRLMTRNPLHLQIGVETIAARRDCDLMVSQA